MHLAISCLVAIYLVKAVLLEKCERTYRYNEKVRKCPFEVPENGTILDRGVCIEKSYDRMVKPKPGGRIENTTKDEMKNRGAKCWNTCKSCCTLSYTPVFVTINQHMVRDINDKRRTLTLDISLTLSWMDQKITTYKPLTVSKDQAELREISMPLSRHIDIWNPDLHVYNLSDYKSFKDSINGVGLTILPTHYQDNGFCLTGPMVKWEIEAKIKFYCELDYTYYPMDRSICKLRFGSSRSDMRFILHDTRDSRFNLEMYRLLDFNVKASIVEERQSEIGKGRVGLEIMVNRSIQPFVLKYYLPCVMITIVSICNFIIPITAIPGRISLIITSLLTLISIFLQQMVRKKCNIL